MQYISTRGGSSPKNFCDILLEGLAEDGGLFVPTSYPQLDLDLLKGAAYFNVAQRVLGAFANGFDQTQLSHILSKTYTKAVFGTPEITPLQWLTPETALLRLSNGPTLAFKDVPLQLLGNLMEYVLGQRGETLNILGATSGDTGSAAEHALKGKKGLRVFMLSPHGRMSVFQQRQMYTLRDPHIYNLVVNGTFDDCQAVVKEVNADSEFKRTYKLGAINSINWARIAAQVVYYVYAYVQAVGSNIGKRVTVAVPSGNFGNALSAYIARQMGVPLDIIVATNENDVLDVFFRTGVYRVRKGSDVKVTSSPSMDIASASNFERLVFDMVGEDTEAVSKLYASLKETGEFTIPPNMREVADLVSGSATMQDVLMTIKRVYDYHRTIIDPHTAVAMHVGQRLAPNGQPLIVAETAQPAKFADTIRAAIDIDPPVPKGFENMANLPQHITRIDPDARVVKQFIKEHVPL